MSEENQVVHVVNDENEAQLLDASMDALKELQTKGIKAIKALPFDHTKPEDVKQLGSLYKEVLAVLVEFGIAKAKKEAIQASDAKEKEKAATEANLKKQAEESKKRA